MLIGIEVDAFDDNSNGQVEALLLCCPVGASTCPTLAEPATGIAATPGSTQVRTNLAWPHANSYVVEALLTGGSNQTRLVGLRVF